MKIEHGDIINSQDIQNAYMKFYSYMMDYLWGMKTVMNLANLEIAIFKRFPEQEEMARYLRLIDIDIRDTINSNDELPEIQEFKEAFEALSECIESYNNEKSMLDIYKVEPEIDIDDIRASSKEEEKPTGEKKTLHVGRIGTK